MSDNKVFIENLNLIRLSQGSIVKYDGKFYKTKLLNCEVELEPYAGSPEVLEPAIHWISPWYDSELELYEIKKIKLY